MNGEQILAVYETIAEFTRQMLAAARASEWERLVALEKDCGAQFARLRAGDDNALRDDGYRRRKAALIRDILDEDAEIRLLVEPWLAQLSRLIGNTRQQARLQRAYRAGE
jgi:flagellar protein FliT